jgi:hypothetical protein
MLKSNYPIGAYALLLLGFTLLQSTVFGQCSISGLDPSYCIDDPAVTLSGTPGGGTFSGPGMTGDDFDPGVPIVQ